DARGSVGARGPLRYGARRMTPPPTALLFDMDGVLVRSEDAWFRVVEEAGERFRGRPVTREEFTPTFGQGTEADLSQFGLRSTTRWPGWARIRPRRGWWATRATTARRPGPPGCASWDLAWTATPGSSAWPTWRGSSPEARSGVVAGEDLARMGLREEQAERVQ